MLSWSTSSRYQCVNSCVDITAFVGMLTGAFGAHGLERRAGITAKDLRAWETASHYAVRSLFAGFRND